jgi:hypothetical protein
MSQQSYIGSLHPYVHKDATIETILMALVKTTLGAWRKVHMSPQRGGLTCMLACELYAPIISPFCSLSWLKKKRKFV